jgi:hypothetical protein
LAIFPLFSLPLPSLFSSEGEKSFVQGDGDVACHAQEALHAPSSRPFAAPSRIASSSSLRFRASILRFFLA